MTVEVVTYVQDRSDQRRFGGAPVGPFVVRCTGHGRAIVTVDGPFDTLEEAEAASRAHYRTTHAAPGAGCWMDRGDR